MSGSHFQLRQELHYTSEKSKERGYQYGECKVYRAEPDKVVFEVSEDPRKKYLSQIRSVDIAKHDNLLRITTTDDTKYIHFQSRSDMEAWFSTIKGLIQTREINEVEFVSDIEGGRNTPLARAQSMQPIRRRAKPENERQAKTSPAVLDDMFRNVVHIDRELKQVSLDDDSPLYENSHFNPTMLEQRDAYLDKHELEKLQEENYQPLIHGQGEDAHREDQQVVDDSVYEDIYDLPSHPLPLSSKQKEASGQAARRKAMLPPKSKKVQKSTCPPVAPNRQNGRGANTQIIEDRPWDHMAALFRQNQNQGPESRNTSESIISRPGYLNSNDTILSRPGSLCSNVNVHAREQNHSLPIHHPSVSDQQRINRRHTTSSNDIRGSLPLRPDQPLSCGIDHSEQEKRPTSVKKERKGRRPMPPPKHTKPKPMAQVQPQQTAEDSDDIYENVESVRDHGVPEPEAKCETGDRVRSFRKGQGTSSVEVEMLVKIPTEECTLGDVSLADKDGAVVIERSNIPAYLEVGDQVLQINGINVEHKGKDFAHICLNSVSSNEINLKILRRFHSK